MYPPPNSLRAPLAALMLGLPAIVAVQTASLWLLAREAPTASVSLERLADAFARPAAAPVAAERPQPAAAVEPPVAERVAVAEHAPVEPAAPVVPAPPPAVAAAIVDAPQPLAPVERSATAVAPHPVAEPVTPPPAAPAPAPAEPVAVAPPAAAPVAPPAAAVPVEAVVAAVTPAPVAEATPPAALPAPASAPTPPAATEAVAPAPAAPIPGLLGPDWVKAQPPRQRTLLLRTEPTLDALRRWLAGRDLELPLAVVESREPGRPGYALLGGSYADSNEAAAAAKALAKRSGVRAWVRRFDQVLPAAGG